MRIGTGANTSTIPAIAVALTVARFGPTIRIKVVLTFRVIDTVMRTEGKVDADGVEKVTPGAVVLGFDGKAMVTVSLALPPNPFCRAYLHGSLASEVVHVKDDPGDAAKLAAPEL